MIEGNTDLARLVLAIHAQRPNWMRDAACIEHPELDFVPGAATPTTCTGGTGPRYARIGGADWGDPTCTRPARGRGLCSAHYVAARRWCEAHGINIGTDTASGTGTVSGGHQQALLDVCHGCLVRSECLDYALQLGIEPGVWGGVPAARREDLAAAMGIRRRQTITVPVQCAECGTTAPPGHTYCSGACRSRAFRRRHTAA